LAQEHVAQARLRQSLMTLARKDNSLFEGLFDGFTGSDGLDAGFGRLDEVMRHHRKMMDKAIDNFGNGLPGFAEHQSRMKEMQRSMDKAMDRQRGLMDKMMNDAMRGVSPGEMFKHVDEMMRFDDFGVDFPDVFKMGNQMNEFSPLRNTHRPQRSLSHGSTLQRRPLQPGTVGGVPVTTLEQQPRASTTSLLNCRRLQAAPPQTKQHTRGHTITADRRTIRSGGSSRANTPQKLFGQLALQPAAAGRSTADMSNTMPHAAQGRTSWNQVGHSAAAVANAHGGRGSFVSWKGN